MVVMDGALNGILSNPDSAALAGEWLMGINIVSAVVSLVICFLGLKLIRIWNTVVGLTFGAVVGLAASVIMGLDVTLVLAVTAGAALVFAILAGVFKKFGAFLFCFFGIAGVALGVIKSTNLIVIAICGAIALIIAILAMIWFEPLVIIVTALSGGFGLGSAAVSLAGLENIYISWAAGAVLAIIGMSIQFLFKSGEIRRKQLRHAKEVQQEISKEAEIEQARAMLDFDDEDDEE